MLKVKDVILGAGSFTESIRMKIKDFLKVEDENIQSASVATRDKNKK